LEELHKNNAQIKLVYELAKSVRDEYFEYFYRGHFTAKITESILSLTEAKFTHDRDAAKIKKKISFVMIECLQNITRHQDSPNDSKIKDSGMFVLQRTRNKVIVTTGNIILNDKISDLEGHLLKIRDLNQDELKIYYQEVLSNGIISEKGGAGLGLIAMARRTNGKIDFKFKNIDETYSYFYLQNAMELEESDGLSENVESLLSLERLSKFHDLLNIENVLLNFNGEFAFDKLETILPILEAQNAVENNSKQTAYDLTVKLLKNIIYFADNEFDNGDGKRSNRGIFLLSKKDENVFLTAGNYILKSKALILRNKIDLMNKTSVESLVKINKYLKEFFLLDESKNPDLSLLDMKLKSKNDLFYSFTSVNETRSFFTLQIVV